MNKKVEENLTWQELEREEEKYDKDSKSRKHRDRKPYKRVRNQGRWWEETEGNFNIEDYPES